MADLTTYGANAFLDGTALPSTLYLQLHSGDPTDAATANVATTSDRQSFTRTAGSGGVCENEAVIEWASALAVENLSHVSVWDAASGGNPWFVGAVDDAKASEVGVKIEIPAGALTLTVPTW